MCVRVHVIVDPCDCIIMWGVDYFVLCFAFHTDIDRNLFEFDRTKRQVLPSPLKCVPCVALFQDEGEVDTFSTIGL